MQASVVRLHAQMRAVAEKKRLALHFHGPRDHLDASIHDYQVLLWIGEHRVAACNRHTDLLLHGALLRPCVPKGCCPQSTSNVLVIAC